MTDAPDLTDPLRRLVLTWGELGQAWGVGRAAGLTHGLLLAAGRPLTADEITAGLGVARSGVSAALRDLRALGLVAPSRTLGERKERFAPLDDPQETIRRLADHARARQVDPALQALTEARDAGAPAGVAALLAALGQASAEVIAPQAKPAAPSPAAAGAKGAAKRAGKKRKKKK